MTEAYLPAHGLEKVLGEARYVNVLAPPPFFRLCCFIGLTEMKLGHLRDALRRSPLDLDRLGHLLEWLDKHGRSLLDGELPREFLISNVRFVAAR